jgi:ParB/RepB/Spo0J family partition protein
MFDSLQEAESKANVLRLWRPRPVRAGGGRDSRDRILAITHKRTPGTAQTAPGALITTNLDRRLILTEKHSTPRKGTTTRDTRQPKDWQCQECGRTMTPKAAEKARGCPGCGSQDIDLADGKATTSPPPEKSTRRPARPARPTSPAATTTGRLKKLPLSLIYPNPDQPRKEFKEAELAELAASIRTHGLLQPIRIRPDRVGTYMIICGERRYRAHLLAGLPEISTHVDDVDDVTVIEQSIVENLQQLDITPLGEARAFQICLEMSVGCHGSGDPIALAQRLGRSSLRFFLYLFDYSGKGGTMWCIVYPCV